MAHEQYPLGVFHKDRELRKMVYVELYEFVPHQDAESARLTGKFLQDATCGSSRQRRVAPCS